MRHRLHITLGFLLFIAVAGCATIGPPPTAEELATADFGPAPEDYETQINAHFAEVLFDPFSARYEFGKPQKAWWGNTGGMIYPRNIHYAWRVDVRVNAKNRMGGYTGWKRERFYFRDGKIVARGED